MYVGIKVKEVKKASNEEIKNANRECMWANVNAWEKNELFWMGESASEKKRLV